MLDVLILDVVSRAPTYGYQVTQTVRLESRGHFDLKEGSLYPALHRLERQKLLSSYWVEADGRRRKFYRLTPAGQDALQARRAEWSRFSQAVNGVLGQADGRIEPA
jgi:DNA-binding PadR family transcriptional regulator